MLHTQQSHQFVPQLELIVVAKDKDDQHNDGQDIGHVETNRLGELPVSYTHLNITAPSHLTPDTRLSPLHPVSLFLLSLFSDFALFSSFLVPFGRDKFS